MSQAKILVHKFLVASLAVAMIAGCSKSTTAPAQSSAPAQGGQEQAKDTKPIKIGAIMSATGGASSLGKPERDTVLMLADQINAAGGINGRKIELVFQDSESDETKAVLAMKKFAGDSDIVGIVGGTTSGESLAMLPEAEKNQVPFISVAASVQIVQPVHKWVFKTPASDTQVVSAIVNHLKSKGMTKVAWMSVNSAFGDSGHVEFDKLGKAAGISLVADDRFGANDTDMTTQATKAKAAGPQAVVVWSTPPAASVAASGIAQVGVNVPEFQSHGIANQAFIDQAKTASENVIFPAQKLAVWDSLPDDDPVKKVEADYVKAFQAKYNYFPTTFGGHAYDAFMMLVDSIKKVGTDRAKVRDNIEGLKNYVSAGGVFNMSATDHMGLSDKDIALVQIKNGKWTRYTGN